MPRIEKLVPGPIPPGATAFVQLKRHNCIHNKTDAVAETQPFPFILSETPPVGAGSRRLKYQRRSPSECLRAAVANRTSWRLIVIRDTLSHALLC